MTKRDKALKYEDAVERLEAIIQRIESGEAGLEQSLEQYEEGMKLIAHCRGILAGAEKKIATLSIDAKGNLHQSSAPGSPASPVNPTSDSNADDANGDDDSPDDANETDEVDGHLDDDHDDDAPF